MKLKDVLILVLATVALLGCGGTEPPAARRKVAGAVAPSTAVSVAGYRDNYIIVKDPSTKAVTLTSKLDGAVATYQDPPLIKFFDKWTAFEPTARQGRSIACTRRRSTARPTWQGWASGSMPARPTPRWPGLRRVSFPAPNSQPCMGRRRHRQLVSTYYRNVLHRDGEQAGIDWWVAQMDNGGDAAGVLLGFADSAENKDSLAAGMQNGFDYIPYNSGGPIIPKRTSYANAKGLNIASQQMPSFPDTAAYNEGATGGVAFADFLQTGQLSLVVFTNRWSHDPKVANPPGAIHFYQYVNGAPVDVTARLLSDTTGCASPRRLLVADFNNDGKPDVFAACHGAEFGDYFSWPGEHPRLLLSQADGTYQNVAAPLNCYCHGATAGDIDGNGTVDILLSDMNAGRDGRASLMALINDGKGNFKVVKADEKQFINQDANYFMGDKPYYNVFLTLELVDFDGDGTLDLLLASGEKTQPTTILKGSGDGLFMKPIRYSLKLLTMYR
jgi:hypothetical protein